MRGLVRCVLLVTVAFASVALASRRWSDYDDTRGTWLKGTIHSTRYERPHQVIELQLDGAERPTWTVVLASPSKMQSRGLPVSRLVQGLKVKVYVYPAIDVPDEARALRISIDGNVTELW